MILSAPTLPEMVLLLVPCHSLLMVLMMVACHSYSLLMVLQMVMMMVACHSHSLLMVRMMVLLRQWRCTNCPASIHRQTIHTPLAHQTQGHTILQSPSRIV